MRQQAVEALLEIADELREGSRSLRACSGRVFSLAQELGREVEVSWSFPVGRSGDDGQYHPPAWYAATLHDESGELNDGYGHTGIDLNVDRWPWGDVDRGQPVFAVADGVIRDLGYSSRYLGSVILEVEHDGGLLYFRYWHLADDSAFRALTEWQTVRGGDVLGHIGNYTLGAGGDHLHLDCATSLFGPHWWFTNHPDVAWVDPVPVLKAHLDAEQVDAMLARDQG